MKHHSNLETYLQLCLGRLIYGEENNATAPASCLRANESVWGPMQPCLPHGVFKVAWSLYLIGFKSPSALQFLSCTRIGYVLKASTSESNISNSFWAVPYTTISMNFTVIIHTVILNTQNCTLLASSSIWRERRKRQFTTIIESLGVKNN